MGKYLLKNFLSEFLYIYICLHGGKSRVISQFYVFDMRVIICKSAETLHALATDMQIV